MNILQTTRTFDEWIEKGYVVKKGSKSTSRNDKGVALFDRTQVRSIPGTWNGIPLSHQVFSSFDDCDQFMDPTDSLTAFDIGADF